VKLSVLSFTVLFCLLPLLSSAKDAPKQDPNARTVDSGTFGVFQNEHRIATETFSIMQSSNGSVATSEFKTDPAVGNAAQSSRLQLTPNGEIISYEWKEISPGTSGASVGPNNEFLAERFHDSGQTKEQQQQFLLPLSTSIVDDYFFVQREILVWRYLATACKTQKGVLQCPLKQEVKFGSLNAHSRISTSVSMSFMGPDDVTVKGNAVKLSRIDMKSDSGSWSLWMDDQFKLIRILDTDTNIEVVRD
jgi:hypothetical protein